MGKYAEEAKCRWRRAEWIVGSGPWASVSECPPAPTIMLFETRAEANIAKRQIDLTGCGGRCCNKHSVVNLQWEERPVCDTISERKW